MSILTVSFKFGSQNFRYISLSHNVSNKMSDSSRRRPSKFNRGSGRHPGHLKGKEIGLFYANKRRNEKSVVGTILLSEDRKRQISLLLKTYNSSNDAKEDLKNNIFQDKYIKNISGSILDKLSITHLSLKSNNNLNKNFYEEFMSKETNSKYQAVLKKRERLPAYEMKDEIVKIIEKNQVCVISGETGCGKTTQVSQFILDEYIKDLKGSLCKIICTQPRRISAISVAHRVAEERAENLGKSVGYQIRLEKRLPRETCSITFCTTGVLLKQMENDPGLSGVSHLILDEIHERDTMSDFLISLLKQVIIKRKDLRVILMSATLDSEKFSKFYNNCPMISIPGFTYHVEEYYLEDVIERTKFVFEEDRSTRNHPGKRHSKKYKFNSEYSGMIEPYLRQLEFEGKYSKQTCAQLRNCNSEKINIELILALLKEICAKEVDEMGAILVFLTGFTEISSLNKAMTSSGFFPSNKFIIIPLHSQMPTVDQKAIFDTPPKGVRKIILSTNIAETSITIDDVVFVVDCGKIKLTRFYLETNVQTLLPEWVTLANANQRKGRAGRVKPGVCFHLYSKAREMLLDSYQTPEILRRRLESVILQIKILQLGGAKTFLGSLMDQPDEKAIEASIEFLQRLNALDESENLTPLGYHLATLPVNPQIGKMLVLASIFSCLDPILSVAAALDYKDPFQLPLGKEKEADAKKFDLGGFLKSDHLLLHETLKRFESESNPSRFCWRFFLSYHILKQLQNMKLQFMEYLYELNFVGDKNPKNPTLNYNSNNISLIKAIICAGLYPNIAVHKQKKFKSIFYTLTHQKLELHPKSILSKERSFDSPLLVYYHRLKSSSDFIYDATIAQPLPCIFFGDRLSKCLENGVNTIVVAEKLKFKCSETTMEIILELRNCLSLFLERKISNPGFVDWNKENTDIKMLEAIMELITSEDIGAIDLEAFDDI
ncbi:ATP-dependent DNA/RNA helicase DHX36-like [Onthophagus taurus]|uniref:ATP-dependent DNA/RNA helicase DHX36-like n=1 Tax=Onthophagus taurus TaxID=166361 RepID=UPI0039BECE71